MKSKGKQSKWSNFEKKQDNKDGEIAKKSSPALENQLLTINTHTLIEFQYDIMISSDLCASKLPTYVEVSVREQNIKFAVQIVPESYGNTQFKNQMSIVRNLTDQLKIEYELGFKFMGSFRFIDQKDAEQYNLDMVEIFIKDYFVSRRDQLKINEKLQNTTVYVNKQISFGPLKLIISNIIHPKNMTLSGIINSNTKILYRSLEAKMTMMVFIHFNQHKYQKKQKIEVSNELFQTDCNEEVELETLQKFLRLFQARNSFFKTNHKLEVYFFARLYYPQFKNLDEFYQFQVDAIAKNLLGNDYVLVPPNPILDYMGRVCVDIVHRVHLTKPLRYTENFYQLCIKGLQSLIYQINWQINVAYYKKKLEENFQTKINQNRVLKLKKMQLNQNINFVFNLRLPECELASFQNSNVLEAICLATCNFSLDYTTRSLNNSGHSVIIVSAGNGLYFGEEQFYKLAKVNLMKNNVSCYLVAFRKSEDFSSPMILLQRGLFPHKIDNFNVQYHSIYDCIENHIFENGEDIREEFDLPQDIQYFNRTGFTKENLELMNDEQLRKRYPLLKSLKCGHQEHLVLKDPNFIKPQVSIC